MNNRSSHNHVLRINNTSRTIAVGDLHGDLDLAICVLHLAKVIEECSVNLDNITVTVIDKKNTPKYYRWIGGDTQVVQVGDQIDRCRPRAGKSICGIAPIENDEHSDIKILNLYTELDKLAILQNGRVINLLGNHEIMNIEKDFRYVSPMGILNYSNLIDLSEIDTSEKVQALYKEKRLTYNRLYIDGLANRRKDFSKNQLEHLAYNRYSAIIIKDILFVHGGITNTNLPKQKFNNINYEVQSMLLRNEKLSHDLHDIFWNRELSEIEDSNTQFNCTTMDAVFNLYDIKRIVVGHTPQIDKKTNTYGITSSCDETVWRIDIAASLAFTNNMSDKTIQVLEILHNNKGEDKFIILNRRRLL